MSFLKARNKNSGFSLVEIIVALAIFAVVAVVAVGALVRIMGANKRAQALSSAVNNVSFSLDAMSREMRVGKSFHCTTVPSGSSPNSYTGSGSSFSSQTCVINGGNLLVFKTSTIAPDGLGKCNLVNAYWFTTELVAGVNVNKIKKAQQTDCSQPITVTDYHDFLSDNITLDDYKLYVWGGSGDPSHPYALAFVRLVGHAGIREQDRTDFDVQTSISQRVPDLAP